MNLVNSKRGQAGLEYLMTYGWALIIIVTIVSILFVLASTPRKDIVCHSNDATKLILQTSYFVKGQTGAFVRIINGTGGEITNMQYTCHGTFDTPENTCIFMVPAPTSVTGGVFELQPKCNCGGTFDDPLEPGTGITIAYTDRFGYRKTTRITCTGSPREP